MTESISTKREQNHDLKVTLSVARKGDIISGTLQLVIGETCHAIDIEDRGNNLAKNLKTRSDLFLKRPTANEYRLTTNVGRSVAYKTIRQLAKGEKIDEF